MKKDVLLNNYQGLRVSDGGSVYLVGIVMIYLAQMLASLALSWIFKVEEDFLETQTGQYTFMAINQIAFISSPFLYGKLMQKPMLIPSKIKRPIKPNQVLICIFLSVGAIFAFLPLANLFLKMLVATGYSIPSLNIPKSQNYGTLLLSLIFIAVLPAISEEFLFRGTIARALKTKNYFFAIIFSAWMFSIMHGNALQFVHQFLLGIVICLAYFITGSLWASIIIHFANNAIALFIDFFSKSSGEIVATISLSEALTYLGMFIVGATILILLFYMLINTVKKNKISLPYFLGLLFNPKKLGYGLKRLQKLMAKSYDDNPVFETKKSEESFGNIEDEQMRKYLIEEEKYMDDRRKRGDKIAISLGMLLASIIWIINLIISYKS